MVNESRQDLLAWINGLTKMNMTKVEQCGTGAALCQVFDSIFLDVPLHRVKFDARAEYAYLENFKVLINTFRKHNVDKIIDSQALVKCKMQDNLDFLQFSKRYWDQYYPGGDYDAEARRAGAKLAGPPIGSTPATSARSGATSSAARRPGPAGAVPAVPRAGSRQAGGLGAGGLQLQAAQQKNAELMETVTGLERERDFYFSKLRDIELLVQQAVELDPSLEEDENGLIRQIQTILYSTEEGFEIPDDQAVGEEETF